VSECGCSIEIKDNSQRGVLVALLAINAIMFFIELGLGLYAESTGLLADSMDMLADAVVYGIGLYVIGRTASHKALAALTSGWFQLSLSLLIAADIIRRFIFGSEPVSAVMICVGILALIANLICLSLIQNHKDGEVHMRASWIFSKNDVIANLGVIISGILVWTLESNWPDLLIGSLIVIVIFNGAIHIIRDARKELSSNTDPCSNSCCKS
jgi:cation diffusion facilitator family transporter